MSKIKNGGLDQYGKARIPLGYAAANYQPAFGRFMGHPPVPEKRWARKLRCIVGASDRIMFINGYHRNQPVDR